MINKKLHVGNVVRIKGQEVPMTVREIKDSNILCQWLNKEHILQSSEFPIEMLDFYFSGDKDNPE